MKRALTILFTPAFSVVLFAIYYSNSFASEVDRIFPTIASFLFAIFTGFFIARQGRRYSDIREKVSSFDGNISSIYRFFGHFKLGAQERVGDIIKKHYTAILNSMEWDYYFTHKSDISTSLHYELKESLDDSVTNSVANGITGPLRDNQLLRKNIIALQHERIPFFQWTFIYTLSTILFITISVIPSEGLLLPTILKTAFIVTIVTILILLHRLDRLELFDGILGKNSAQDVIDTIEGKK